MYVRQQLIEFLDNENCAEMRSVVIKIRQAK